MVGHYTVWDKSTEKQALQMYKGGASLKAVSMAMGVSVGTVQNLVNKHGCMRSAKSHSVTMQNKLRKCARRIRSMYLVKRMVISEIASELGMPVQWIERHVKKEGYARTLSETFQQISVPRKRHFGTRRTSIAVKHLLDMGAGQVDWKVYQYKTRKLTEIVWARYKHLYPKHAKRGHLGYHVDHRISVFNAYYVWSKVADKCVPREQPLDLRYLCHPANLDLIPCVHNVSKSSANSITFAELKKRVVKFEATHGPVFEAIK